MTNVAELQKKYDEISAIRQAVKSDWSVSNARKREISIEYAAACRELRAASEAAMAAAAQAPNTAPQNFRRQLQQLTQHSLLVVNEAGPILEPPT